MERGENAGGSNLQGCGCKGSRPPQHGLLPLPAGRMRGPAESLRRRYYILKIFLHV